jgi:NhaC family Na+:H+ antiporter
MTLGSAVAGSPGRWSGPRPPSTLEAWIPVAALVGLIVLGVGLYGGDLTAGPVQVALILCAILAGLIGRKNGHSMETLAKAAVDAISTAMGAIFILLAVGALIGTWNMSGTVATMVHVGIRVLDADWFYLAATLVCAGVALGIGSAWTVIGTLGVALMAIATAIGVSPLVTAGAIVSGAYFGDKMSPLSDTTNLAPAVAGTDLYTHIRAMMASTVPSVLIALGLFAFLGLTIEPLAGFDVTALLAAIESIFDVGLLTLLPLFVVIVLAVRRVPPTITILSGALTGGAVAVLLQPDVVLDFVAEPDLAVPLAMLKGVWSAMATGFTLESGLPGLDALVSGGGMASMLGTVWLILAALAFGGIMEYTGSLARLIEPLVRRARSARSLLISTGLTAIGVNIVAADQYMAIVLTGRMYRTLYEEQGIAPQTLSRQVEDTATVTSPLIPWNSCGAYVAATLGIATLSYLPFCFFNLVNPLVSFVLAALGRAIIRTGPKAGGEAGPSRLTIRGVSGRQVGTAGPPAGE